MREHGMVSGLWTWSVVMVMAAAGMTGCQGWGGKAASSTPALQEAQRLKLAGQNADALATAQRYLTDNPKAKDRSDALLLTGDCEMALGQYAPAQKHYEDAQRPARTNAIAARARFGMGEAAFAQESYSDAIKAYEYAIKTGKNDIPAAKATYKLGLAQVRNGNWNEGRTRMREVRDHYGTTEQSELAQDVLSTSNDAFQLQCGAFTTQANTEGLVQQLKGMGFAPQVKPITRGGKPWYAVRVGNYNTYPDARTAMDKLRAKRLEPIVFP